MDGNRTSQRRAWEQARESMDGLPNGRGLDIAHEAAYRRVAHGRDSSASYVG